MILNILKDKMVLCLLALSLSVNYCMAAGMTKFQLKIWNSPEFQEQFVESYMAETEIEPRVTVTQRDEMIEIMALLSGEAVSDSKKKKKKDDEEPVAISEEQAATNMQKAADKLVDLVEKDDCAIYAFTLANIYFQQEQFDDALKLYEVSVEKFPKFRRAWKNMAMIYVRQGEFEKAVPALTRVIELGGNDSVTYGLLGYGYSSMDNNISAESAYRMAILLDPKTFDWKMGLARCFFKQGRFKDAISLCDVLIKDQPENVNLWLLQANAYIADGNSLKAAEIYEIVDVMGGSTADSLNMLGDIYVNQELYDLAVKSYMKAMDFDGVKPDRAVRSAKVLVARGAMKETSSLLEKLNKVFAGKLDDTLNKDVLKLQARLAVASGQADEEVKVLEEIVKLDPLDGEALILLGQNFQRNGDNEKAIFYYERAASIEKYEADAKVRHAQLLVGQGKYNEALPLLKRAQDIKPRENVREFMVQVEKISKTSK